MFGSGFRYAAGSYGWRTFACSFTLEYEQGVIVTLTIDLPDDLDAALKAHAKAQGVSAAGFVSRVIQQALSEKQDSAVKPKKSAYGILARYGPGPSEEEIDRNRREMFSGFGEDVP